MCFRHFMVVLVAVFLWSATVRAGELRTWTDRSGKFSVKAKFVSEIDGMVTLLNEAGKKLVVPIDQLSEADQRFVGSLRPKPADNPFQPVEENPFRPLDDGPRLVEVDLSTVREVQGLPKNSTWKFEAPADRGRGQTVYRPVTTPRKRDFWEKFQGFAVSPPSGRALFGYALRDKKTQKLSSRYFLADIVRGEGKSYEVPDLDSPMFCMALSDDGNHAVVRRNDWGFGQADFLELWTFTESDVKRELKWYPHKTAKGGSRDIKRVGFLPNDRVLTVSGGGRIVIWASRSVAPIYHFRTKGDSYPALSPDRRLLCYSRGEDLGVLDLEKGEVLAVRRVGALTRPNLQFNPSGTKVACLDHSRLKVFDFTTGELLVDMPKRGFPHGGYRFVSEDHVLVNGSALVDVKNQLVVWTYQDTGAFEQLGEYTCFLTKGSNSSGLLMLERLPQQVVTDTLAKAMQDEDFWVLNKGTTVRLDLTGIRDAAGKEQVKASLSKKLADHGISVGEDGTIDLVASIEEKKARKKVSYSVGFGPIPPSPFGRGGLKYEVKEFVSHLKFIYKGETAWESQANNIPSSFRLKDGETIEKLLRRHEKPNYAWYERVELPGLLRKPSGSPTLGVTKVTSAGLR